MQQILAALQADIGARDQIVSARLLSTAAPGTPLDAARARDSEEVETGHRAGKKIAVDWR